MELLNAKATIMGTSDLYGPLNWKKLTYKKTFLLLTFHSNAIPAYNMHIFRETNFRLKKR